MSVKDVREMFDRLIQAYANKYPHNPDGVLNLHIDKLTKEGHSKEKSILILAERNNIPMPEHYIEAELRELYDDYEKSTKQFKQKSVAVKETVRIPKRVLFDNTLSDEEVEEKIMELQNEAMKSDSAVSSLPVVSALLKGGDPRLTGMFVLLQGIYQQNKIIILQNELLRRKLRP